MEDVLAFIKEQKVTYLATIEGDQARVRPMSGLVEMNGKLAWCTNKKGDVFKEVAKNPKIEFCMYTGGKTVRLSGSCFLTDTDEAKAAFLEIQPAVANYYGGGLDEMAVMIFEDAQAFVAAGKTKEVVTLY
ncbi:MAG: pyridoxamine 5'-phosphate oxidase family protein [Defluviitaleaceae bacterium]|nr:pyridoxamine 5'-phosphate oxidase family protein [Defluviitaleaceae bacterium]